MFMQTINVHAMRQCNVDVIAVIAVRKKLVISVFYVNELRQYDLLSVFTTDANAISRAEREAESFRINFVILSFDASDLLLMW